MFLGCDLRNRSVRWFQVEVEYPACFPSRLCSTLFLVSVLATYGYCRIVKRIVDYTSVASVRTERFEELEESFSIPSAPVLPS